MYNYYIFQKKQIEENKKDTSVIRDYYRKISHKVKNYNNRINKFVFDMAKSPMIIKDYINPVESTRKQLMNETGSKFYGAKDFTFKPYITEKERIKQYLEDRKRNGEDFEATSREQPSSKLDKSNNNNLNNTCCEQPKMRFKPRTDLERIAESIRDFNFTKINQEILKKQLENKNKKNNVDTSSSEQSFDEFVLKHGNDFEKKRLLLNSQGGEIAKSKQIDSLVAKQLMSEYHNKTHFKAAMSLIDHPPVSHNRNMKLNKSLTKGEDKTKSIISRSKTANVSPQAIKKHGYLTSQYLHLKRESEKDKNTPTLLNQFANKFPLAEDNIDLVEANPLLYNLDFHLMKNASHLDLTLLKMDYLKRLAFESKDVFRLGKSRNNEKMNDVIQTKIKDKSAPRLSLVSNKKRECSRRQIHYVDKNKIIIDDEEIPKDKIDVIAKKVLRKCNYSHSKNLKNNSSLKKGEGKLMITSGMTVNEFNLKHLFVKKN